MLRRVLLSSAGALALSGAAFAADLPSRAPPPVFVPPPLFSWTGIYAGINAGYHWGGSSYSFIGTDTDGAGLGSALGAGAILAPAAHGSNGFIGGGQIGYNYQIQSFVLGLEVDIDGATGRNSVTDLHGADLGFVPIASNSAQQLDWLGTVRGRLGWTPIDHLLIYGTGGLAFGQSQAAFTVVAPTAGPSAVCLLLDLGPCRLGCGRWHRICAAGKLVELVGESRVSLLRPRPLDLEHILCICTEHIQRDGLDPAQWQYRPRGSELPVQLVGTGS